MIGIIGAMHEEVIELKELMEGIKKEKIGGFEFFLGKLEGQDVVVVEGGIGKVNASICTTLLIREFKIEKLIFTGVAGGTNPEINVGDIVVSNALIQHDFDCVSFGMKPGEIPRMGDSKFVSDKNLAKLACEVAIENFGEERTFHGTIVSGDQFIAEKEKIKWLRETFNAECTEMEGAAVAHVCQVLEVPFVIIRSISDKANDDAKHDFQKFVKLAAKNSKTIIIEILKKI